MTTDTSVHIHLPSANDLDSGDYSLASGWLGRLYLVPAAETTDGSPAVRLFSGFGMCWPQAAHERRWRYLGSYGPMVVGQSIREQLDEQAEELVELSGEYIGDGHWRWPAPEDDYIDRDRIRHYWTAEDWYGAASLDWGDLCYEAGVDPEQVLGDDWEDVVAEVLAIIKRQDEPVIGTEKYLRMVAEEYRDNMR